LRFVEIGRTICASQMRAKITDHLVENIDTFRVE
jgi:hypothetical protein